MENAHALENLKTPSAVEELPEYTAHPPLPDRREETQRLSRRWRWFLLLLTAILIIVGASVGGVLGYMHHKDQEAAEAAKDPPDPIITALTTTECVAGTFVFYQTNTSDIYLHGQLWGGYWNHTGSSEIPSMRLNLSNPHLRPIYGSNLTAVAYTGSNETLNEDVIVSILF
jgi:hypothetical protein